MDAKGALDAAMGRFFMKAVSSRGGMTGTIRAARCASFLQSQKRKRAMKAREGLTVPPLLIMSVTRRCNLDCAGCYSQALRPGQGAELSDERFASIAAEALSLGVSSFLIAGGEPLLRPRLLERIAALPGHVSAVFTNGTLLGNETLGPFSSGRLAPILSIEGGEAFTRERRGKGVHEGALRAAALLRSREIHFGVSITLTSRNAESVLSGPFLDWIAELGASALFLVEYVPVSPGTAGLALTRAQRGLLASKGDFRGLPFSVATLPGDEEAYDGCMAAGRGFIHVSDDGRVEACPFAPFSDSQVATAGLEEALRSPLMAAIRERHSELTETSGGCALWNKQGWISRLGACAAVEEESLAVS
jgi:MoaA/NifB/PqqE/SkfB family radical SAM enzyme